MDQNVICCLFDNKELNTDLYSSIYTLYFAMYQNWGTVLVRVEIKSASNFRHINLKLCMVSPQSFKSVQLKIFVLLMFKNWYQVCSSGLQVHLHLTVSENFTHSMESFTGQCVHKQSINNS